jgi:hypothetical protein
VISLTGPDQGADFYLFKCKRSKLMKQNVILHKQQYRKIKKMLVKSDPAWVRYTDVFFTDEKTAVFEMKSMVREGLYVFGYLCPAFYDLDDQSKILFLLESDLDKTKQEKGKIPKSTKRNLILNWRRVLSGQISEIHYKDYKRSRYEYNPYWKNAELAAQKARQLNINKRRPGILRVVNIGRRFSYPIYPGYRNICVCNRTRSKTKELASVNMGPITKPLVNDLFTLWMKSKICDEDFDQNGDYIKSYLRRISERNEFEYSTDIDYWKDRKTLFYYWQGKELNEIEARRKIFCPLYVEFARETDSFRKIRKLLQDGYNVQLIGYDTVSYSSAYDPNGHILEEIFNDPKIPYSNAHVLAGMLTKNHVWE